MNWRLSTGLGYKAGNRDRIEHFIDERTILAPTRWRKPRRIFISSMTDIFGDWVRDEWLDEIFAVMAICPQHTFQVLTKRPERMQRYICEGDNEHGDFFERLSDAARAITRSPRDAHVENATWPLQNVWLGVTAENQAAADRRIPYLLDTPAAVRFVSCEPLLEKINLTGIHYAGEEGYGAMNALAGEIFIEGCGSASSVTLRGRQRLNWVIAGGETGRQARPSDPDWFRSLRDQCRSAGVPFFHKQNGEWLDVDSLLAPGESTAGWRIRYVNGLPMARCGKKRAGRLLDGREHNEFPV